MVRALTYGWEAVKQQWRAGLLIYVIQLLLSLTLGVQVFHVLEASIGDSLSMDILSKGFSRTVFEDFFNNHGASVSPLVGMARWIIIVYLLISILLHGGLLSNIIHQKRSISDLFKAGARYYFPFFIIVMTGLLLLVLITGFVWIPTFALIGNPLEGKVSEPVFALVIAIAIFIYFVLVLHIMLWSLNSRISYLHQPGPLWLHIRRGWQKLVRFWRNQVGVSLLFFIIYLIMAWIYSRIIDDWGASSYLIIWGTILLQQAFVFTRVMLRVAFFGGITDCCADSVTS